MISVSGVGLSPSRTAASYINCDVYIFISILIFFISCRTVPAEAIIDCYSIPHLSKPLSAVVWSIAHLLEPFYVAPLSLVKPGEGRKGRKCRERDDEHTHYEERHVHRVRSNRKNVGAQRTMRSFI